MNAKILIFLFLVVALNSRAQTDTIVIAKPDTSLNRPHEEPKDIVNKHPKKSKVKNSETVLSAKPVANFNINIARQNYAIVTNRFGFIKYRRN
jgi:hypothetical protein